MLLRNYQEVNPEPVDMEGAKGVKVRWVISQKDGAPTFAMRVFEIEPKGFTPYHKHEWEHEVFIKNGEGTVVSEGKEFPFKTGDAVFIPPNEIHQFKNTSDKKLEFLCLVPHHK
jgi:quercetin dioxygenase-like cupin family protein